MPRTPKNPDVRPLPTRDEVLTFLGSAQGRVGKREIARAFGVNAAGRIELKRMIKDLQGEGLVARNRNALVRPGRLPSITAADITTRDADGDFFAIPVDWDTQEFGPPPRILVHVPRRKMDGPAPGLGDRVLLRIEETGERDPAYAGRFVKLLAKKKDQVLGVFRADKDGKGGGRVAPVDKKAQGRELLISPGDENGAEDGDLVAVETTLANRFGLRQAKVRERLGSIKSERAVSMIAIHTHMIPHVFPPAVLSEADAARPVTLATAGSDGREDWRHLPLITIDPPDAKDHDDAVHAEIDLSPDNPGGFILSIAIADVAAYVKPGSRLDKEALERGNSVYFPDRVVPMLPERISNDLCSLRPLEDRPAIAVQVIIDRNGQKKSHSFHRIMMRSAAKLAYAQAQSAMDGITDDITSPILTQVIKPLWGAYDALKKARAGREPLDLDLPERKLRLNEDGTIRDVYVPERLDSMRLIEEFMILANVCAAETLEKQRQLLMYRIHDEPSLEKMNSLREFLQTIQIDLSKGGNVRPALFNRILARVQETENAPLVNEVVLRSQSQAVYSPENIGHFGLNLRRYAHFTSPIRRYADLIVHRALIRACKLGKDGLPDVTLDQLKDIGEKISAAERRAMAAERETIDRLVASFLADQVGASFDGRVTGVTRAGLFVRLATTGADGFIPASTLGTDYFRHDESAHALIGERSGESFRLGDQVRVKLVEALPVAGALRFEMISEGRFVKGGGARRRGAIVKPDRARASEGHKKRMARGKRR
ncbi:MAG: ribonuclease R [Beijerinckiaceae bacterium]|nr:ribonuclease R [Beijerinckiaceae bacterium]